MNRIILAPLVLLLGGCLAHAEERASHTYLPARFGTGSDSLLAQLRCPDERGPERRTVVFCQAHVLADGRSADSTPLSNSFCFGAGYRNEPDGETKTYSARRYVSAVRRALQKSRFLPAEVDHVAVPVHFPFHVVFEDKAGCVATAYPNLGIQRAELGMSYVAPQEIVAEGSWVKRMRFFDPFAFPAIGIFFSSSVLVNENGSAVAGRVEYTNPASISRAALAATDMAADAATALQGSKFIPGFYEGSPFPMRYLGILFVGPLPF